MPAVRATQTLTFTGQPANTETVTIGAKVYTFQTSLTNSDGNVLIGGTTAASIQNLQAAINLAAGAGTTYALATTLNPTVKATAITATTLVVGAKIPGLIANHVPTTETVVNATWGAATLAGGTGDAEQDIRVVLAAENLNASAAQRVIDIIDPDGDE